MGEITLDEAIEAVQRSFKAAHDRGDAAFYIRPEYAWVLLDAAERWRANREMQECRGGYSANLSVDPKRVIPPTSPTAVFPGRRTE